jgi:hypothetical protein
LKNHRQKKKNSFSISKDIKEDFVGGRSTKKERKAKQRGDEEKSHPYHDRRK